MDWPWTEVESESESEVSQLCPTLCNPMDCSPPALLSMGSSRQEYWSGLLFPYQGQRLASHKLFLLTKKETSRISSSTIKEENE